MSCFLQSGYGCVSGRAIANILLAICYNKSAIVTLYQITNAHQAMHTYTMKTFIFTSTNRQPLYKIYLYECPCKGSFQFCTYIGVRIYIYTFVSILIDLTYIKETFAYIYTSKYEDEH